MMKRMIFEQGSKVISTRSITNEEENKIEIPVWGTQTKKVRKKMIELKGRKEEEFKKENTRIKQRKNKRIKKRRKKGEQKKEIKSEEKKRFEKPKIRRKKSQKESLNIMIRRRFSIG